MYNENIKQRYLDEMIGEDNKNIQNIIYYFSKTEFLENVFGKDIYDWNEEDIVKFYKYMATPSPQMLITINTCFDKYTQWAILNNMVTDYQNHYQVISRDLIVSCINIKDLDNKIITEDQLEFCLGKLPNPSDKFILLCLWEGIRGQKMADIVGMRLSEINEDGTVLLKSGRTVKLSKRLMDLAESSEKEYSYYSLTPNGIETPLECEKDVIVKKKTNSKRKNIILFHKIKKIVDFCGLPDNITAMSVFESGRLNYIKHGMQETGLDMRSYISKYRKEIYEKYNSKIQSIDLYVKKFEDYM